MEKFLFSSLKVFLWITIGAVIKLIFNHLELPNFKKTLKYTTEFIVTFIVPYFVGIRIWLFGIEKTVLSITILWFVVTLIISYLITKFIIKRWDYTFKEVFLPLAFTNSLYLGIPVTQYFVSENAVYYTIIYVVVATLTQFTFGVYILSSSTKFFRIILSTPIIYFSIIGYSLSIYQVQIPAMLKTVNNIISSIISPLMLIFVGFSFQWEYILEKVRLHIFLNIARIMIIFTTSIVFILVLKTFLELNKEFVKAIVLVSLLPSAIANYVLAEKFNVDTKFVSGEIFWGTILVLFLLPYIAELLEILLLFTM
ncbi:MAG: AEC family transporter [Endomicrobia bacterium]|nr:AEC family transporter [Endomicrobiia bacterium]